MSKILFKTHMHYFFYNEIANVAHTFDLPVTRSVTYARLTGYQI